MRKYDVTELESKRLKHIMVLHTLKRLRPVDISKVKIRGKFKEIQQKRKELNYLCTMTTYRSIFTGLIMR